MLDPDRPATAPVSVETFGLRLERGVLAARRVTSALRGDPDDDAARAIGLDAGTLPGAVLHSTSWRWECGEIVLTYVCCPDPLDHDACLVPPEHGHPGPSEPTLPGAGPTSVGQVLHHGIDHLAWLADHHDDLVEASRHTHPELWSRITQAGRHRAGQLRH
ncbi:MAG: hypothetical protein AAGD18_21525 [Actinomycetota bacterium]